MSRLINVLVRSITLIVRLQLVIFLAKTLSIEEFGSYSLFVAVAAYSTLILGFDAYTYFQRLIDHTNRAHTTAVIKAQLRVQSLAYLVVIPACLVMAFYFGIKKEWLTLLIIIAILEHVAQEIYRILIMINKNTEASLNLFLRAAAWVLILLIISGFKKISLPDVYYMWMSFSLVSSVFGVYIIKKDLWCKGMLTFRISLVQLLKTAAFFLISSLSFKLLFTLDRSFVARFGSLEMLGAYALYSGIAATLISFLSPTVISFGYPKLIHASNHSDIKQFLHVTSRMLWEILAVSTGFLMCVYLFAPSLLNYIGKANYIDNVNILYFVCGASTLYALSMVPHYVLYALRREIHITISSVASVILFIVSFFILLEYFSADLAVALSAVLAFAFLAAYKGIMGYTSFTKKKWVLS